MNRLHTLFIVFLLYISLVFPAFGQTSFRANIPGEVQVGQQFNISFEINADAKQFKGPSFNGFEVLSGPNPSHSSSFQIINGKTTQSSSTVFSYYLRATKEGKYTIAPATAIIDGKTYESNSAIVRVVKSTSTTTNSAASSDESNTGQLTSEDLYIKAEVNKSSVYQGEEVILTYYIYTRVPVSQFSIKGLPKYNGFWTETITRQDEKPNQTTRTINGQEYIVAEIYRLSLFPSKSGNLLLNPMEVECIAQIKQKKARRQYRDPFDAFFNDPFFGGNAVQQVKKVLKSNQITLTVKPLPKGAPSTFKGTVGEYQLKAKLDKTRVKENDAIQLSLSFSGKGNLNLIEQPPMVFPPDFEVYDPKENTQMTKSKSGISGTKTFDYLIIPRSAGTFTIPAMSLTYFDVPTKQYKTLSTPSYTIQVDKGDGVAQPLTSAGLSKEEVKLLSADIKYIKTKSPHFTPMGAYFFQSWTFYFLLMLPFFLLFLLMWIGRKEIQKRSNIALMRHKNASKLSKKHLKIAHEHLNKQETALFYDALSKALWGYAADKLTIPLSDLSMANLEEKLVEKNISPTLIQQLKGVLEACSFARFAPTSSNHQMDTLYESATQIIHNMEKELKEKTALSSISASIILLWLIGASSLGMASTSIPSETLFNNANAFYEQGKYTQAITTYTTILEKKETSASLYFNLGNCYYKLNDMPSAILYYEKAKKISPSDADLLHNLTLANAKIKDKKLETPQWFFIPWVQDLRDVFSADTWGIWVILFSFITVSFFGLYLIASKISLRKLFFYLSVFTFLLGITSYLFGYAAHASYQKETAIIFTPTISVKSSPNNNSTTLFILHEGTKIDIIDNVSNWYRIKLPNGTDGWISKKEVKII